MAFKRIGYGQVEPNQLSGIKTGQIFASLPLAKNVNVIQNGEFMYYDYVSGTVSAEDSTSVAEPMLVYNEIKIYEPWLSYKDFAMIRVGDNYVTSNAAVGRVTSANVDGTVYGDGATTEGAEINPAHTEYGYRMDGIAPRLVKTNVGDIFTTNMVDEESLAVGDILAPRAADGILVKDNSQSMKWQVVKVYTMPDFQKGVKLMRIA